MNQRRTLHLQGIEAGKISSPSGDIATFAFDLRGLAMDDWRVEQAALELLLGAAATAVTQVTSARGRGYTAHASGSSAGMHKVLLDPGDRRDITLARGGFLTMDILSRDQEALPTSRRVRRAQLTLRLARNRSAIAAPPSMAA